MVHLPLVRGQVVCGRRVRKLYLVGRYFGCRRCHDLTFTSTQQSHARVYAAVRGGIDFSRIEDLENMTVQQLGFAHKVFMFEEKRIEKRLRPRL